MNDLELTELFVERRKTADNLAEIDKKIKDAIMERGESFSSAGVKATYYSESVSCDYETAAKDDPRCDSVKHEFTTIRESVSWKDVCEKLGIDLALYSDKNPARVVVK